MLFIYLLVNFYFYTLISIIYRYVQHKIKEAGSIVWDFLQRNGYVMVAGSSRNMPSSVREAIRHVIQEHGGLSPADAELFLLNMEKTGRYQTETWG